MRLETRVKRVGLAYRVEVYDSSTETWRRHETARLTRPTPGQIEFDRDDLVAGIRRELLEHARDLEELAGRIE